MRTPFILLILLTLTILAGCGLQRDASPKAIRPGSQQETHQQWKEVQRGLSYTHIQIPTNEEDDYKTLLLVRIDPKKYTFSIYQNENPRNAKTIEEIHHDEGALLTFNGQFFTEEFKPTGLLISEGVEIRNYSLAHLLNGMIAIDRQGNVQFFDHPRGLNEKNFTFAIQNGPVLLGKDGEIKITEDSGDKASRTAMGLDKDGNIVLIVLKQSLLDFDNSVTLSEFADILKNHEKLQDIGLHSVLNFDGGSSSGLIIDNKYYPEMEKVQNVVLVKER